MMAIEETAVQSFKEQFHQNFSHLRQVPLLLYGVGEYTDLILKQIDGYRFVGLLDQQAIGQTVYGLPVLPLEGAEREARVILIVASLPVAPVIYRRIRGYVLEHGMDVYYLNGCRPEEEKIPNDPYWEFTREQALDQIRSHDVISFDVFDTLIVRRCLRPEAIFTGVEEYARKQGYELLRFVQTRVEAEKECYRSFGPAYGLDEIYGCIQKKYGLSHEMSRELKRAEWKLEFESAAARREVGNLLREAKKLGKTVIAVSDMYLDRGQMRRLLDKCGMNGFAEIYISCEQKCSKYQGDMWELIRKRYAGKRILHIGDHEVSDGQSASRHGIDPCLIKSVDRLSEMTGVSGKLESAGAWAGHLMRGTFLIRCFEDPLAANKMKGSVQVNTMEELGYLFYGPLVLTFLSWLFQEIKKNGLEYLLFVSRDGYLFIRLYQYLIETFQMEDAPRAVYFLTSRRAASVACIQSPEDIEFILDKMCKSASITYEDMISRSFGISADKRDPYFGTRLFELRKEELKKAVVSSYLNKILARATEERAGYQRYIHGLGFLPGKRAGLFNFVGRGVTQKFLSKLLDLQMTGLYVAMEIGIEEILPAGARVSSLYPGVYSAYTAQKNLIANYLFGEAVFTAPEGQLEYFNAEGRPVYKDESGRNVKGILKCQEGVIRYVKEMARDREGFLEMADQVSLADSIFGLFTKNNFCLGNEIKESFIFIDPYCNVG